MGDMVLAAPENRYRVNAARRTTQTPDSAAALTAVRGSLPGAGSRQDGVIAVFEAGGLYPSIMMALDVGAPAAAHGLPQERLGHEALELFREAVDVPLRTQERALAVDDHLGDVGVVGGHDRHTRRLGLEDRDRSTAFAVSVACGHAGTQEDVMLEEQALEHGVRLKADPAHRTARPVDQGQDLALLLVIAGLAGTVSHQRDLNPRVKPMHTVHGAQRVRNALLLAEGARDEHLDHSACVGPPHFERQAVQRDSQAVDDDLFRWAVQSSERRAHRGALGEKRLALAEQAPVAFAPDRITRELGRVGAVEARDHRQSDTVPHVEQLGPGIAKVRMNETRTLPSQDAREKCGAQPAPAPGPQPEPHLSRGSEIAVGIER